MNTYDITSNISDIDEIPLCPLCGQPIGSKEEAAIGECFIDGFRIVCLVHDYCGQLED